MITRPVSRLLTAAAALLLALQACSRPPRPPASPAARQPPAAEAPSAVLPEPEGIQPSRPQPRPSRDSPSPAARSLPIDMLLGSRPLDRIGAEDYTLGPLQTFRGLPGDPGKSAPGAVRNFLRELEQGRLDAAEGNRDILEFVLSDILEGRIRISGWKIGHGLPRPEGGYTFPILLESGEARARGEILAGLGKDARWTVELVILGTAELQTSGTARPAPFDPTIKTVRSTQR